MLGLGMDLEAQATVRFESGPAQVSLLELYTSEGCSSCPPAERWMARLKDSADLWTGFAPVVFHVDYWDSLGWKAPWSSTAFADRERAYAQVWGSDTIYTPCYVLDGREWRNWSFHQ